jgi:hypothetical protein
LRIELQKNLTTKNAKKAEKTKDTKTTKRTSDQTGFYSHYFVFFLVQSSALINSPATSHAR